MGTVYVLGSELDVDARQHLYRTICARVGIACYPLPDQVMRIPQVDAQGRTAWALVNTGRTATTISLPGPGRDLLSGAMVETGLAMPGNSNAFVLFAASFPG